ncbi:MAG: SEC-C metal-binding domain-containing protein, partial [Planctomycetaceae bacterium]
WNAVVDEIREVHKSGRPILVGTVSIEESERVASKLDRHGIKHDVLNAKHHEREAEIIAQAGRMSGVTIATNMAGRGTDIILGGNPENAAWEQLKHTYESRLDIPKAEWEALTADIARREGMYDEGRKVAELGGLHVVGTQRHEARRIDLQLRGRAGRQGDPGASRFFLSLEDELMRKFAGDWVRNMLTRLGMQEGEAIESRMVTRRIEAAQKKVEERNFDIRKNLLEYDEVMDEQRKQMYSFRQRILDGANCRDIILEMIEKQIGKGVGIFLDDDYRWETITEWAKIELHLDVDAAHIRDMDREQLSQYLLDEARAQGEEQIAEQIDENLPADAEDRSEWNWQALSKWANSRFGLNTNDRELKKIDRDGVHDHLRDRAFEAIERYDLSPLDHFLEEDFPQQQLCGWLQHQFTLHCTPEEFQNVEDESEAIERVLEKIRGAYREKEILFPVAVGMTNCFSNQQTGGERDRREKLVHWANHRFGSTLDAEQLRGKSHQDIQNVLADASRRYFIEIDRLDQVDDYLDRAYGENGRDVRRNGQAGGNGHVENPDVLAELTGWAGRELHVNLQPSDLQELDRESARQRLLTEYDNRYRPELAHAERALLLDVIDTAWKDHLYYMDHLRSGIGLVGYAQKDPKVEYKREGRKASIQMWERIGQQVTGAIFRLERQSPEFVGSLWQITATQHEAFNSSPGTTAVEMESNRAEPGADVRTIDPIVNRAPKVGRNDPCPCGSGKKYKKCHGANA